MDKTSIYSTINPIVYLAAERLLDAIEASPRSLAEFDAGKTKSLHAARAALTNEPARRLRTSRDWLRIAARLGRQLGARGGKDHALWFAADFLRLSQLCDRSACHRAQSCRGAARVCLARSAPRVPKAVHESITTLCERLERGDSLELAIALLPFECKAALWAWWRVVKNGSGSILSFRGASAAREPGIQKRSHVYLDSGSPQSRRPE